MIDACFVQWMDQVNTAWENNFGFGIDDMPDFDYTSCYMSDMSVAETLDEYKSFYSEFSL